MCTWSECSRAPCERRLALSGGVRVDLTRAKFIFTISKEERKMTDAELRGLVLKRFYDLRHQQNYIQLNAIVSIDIEEPLRVANICKQLDQHGLIEWRAVESWDRSNLCGIGEITAHGVDVIEGTASSQIAVTVHDHRISVRESSYVQIGNSNTQHVSVDVEKLISAVDHSDASAGEKQEAQSLLEKLAGNRLIQLVWAIVFGSSAS